MDVILHLGAHRSGSTSFQHYMRANAEQISAQSIAFWGPLRTRNGLLHSLAERPTSVREARRAAGRVKMNLASTERRGAGCLIVSDENMIGTPRHCLRAGRLYPEIGERMARLMTGFAGARRVVLQIRSLEIWWASMFAHLVMRGETPPERLKLQAIASNMRSWRAVITDLACACPNAQIMVTPFEHFGAHPDRLFGAMSGALIVPEAQGAFWVNRSADRAKLRACLRDRGQNPELITDGDGRWSPFTQQETAQLREAYADDVFWLQAGADGLATLTEDQSHTHPAQTEGWAKKERRHERPAKGLG